MVQLTLSTDTKFVTLNGLGLDPSNTYVYVGAVSDGLLRMPIGGGDTTRIDTNGAAMSTAFDVKISNDNLYAYVAGDCSGVFRVELLTGTRLRLDQGGALVTCARTVMLAPDQNTLYVHRAVSSAPRMGRTRRERDAW
jgi:DNA-binding beta-propeller fold protein YncE